jgi:hypothetical protein
LSNPHFLACRKRSCPALPPTAHEQFYSVNPCSKSMANTVYKSQGNKKIAFHPANAGKTNQSGTVQIIFAYRNLNLLCFYHTLNKTHTGRCGRGTQAKQCGIPRRRRRVRKSSPIKWNRYLTTRFLLQQFIHYSKYRVVRRLRSRTQHVFWLRPRPHLQWIIFLFMCFVNSTTN